MSEKQIRNTSCEQENMSNLLDHTEVVAGHIGYVLQHINTKMLTHQFQSKQKQCLKPAIGSWTN